MTADAALDRVAIEAGKLDGNLRGTRWGRIGALGAPAGAGPAPGAKGFKLRFEFRLSVRVIFHLCFGGGIGLCVRGPSRLHLWLRSGRIEHVVFEIVDIDELHIHSGAGGNGRKEIVRRLHVGVPAARIVIRIGWPRWNGYARW